MKEGEYKLWWLVSCFEILDRVVKESLTEKMTFEERSEGSME